MDLRVLVVDDGGPATAPDPAFTEAVAGLARKRGAGVYCAVSGGGANPWRAAPGCLAGEGEACGG